MITVSFAARCVGGVKRVFGGDLNCVEKLRDRKSARGVKVRCRVTEKISFGSAVVYSCAFSAVNLRYLGGYKIVIRRCNAAPVRNGAQGQNRTADTRIFSPLLYRLSYLGTKLMVAY